MPNNCALRIKKVVGATTTLYVYSGSRPIVEYENSSVSREYIYAGSKLVATITPTGTTYHHPDHISDRAETDASGNVVRTFGHLPYDELWYEPTGTDKDKFTSYERDPESGLDYAMFRQYGPGQGRFMSADLLGGHMGVPQSMNRYGYVGNDPINFIDPLGLQTVVSWTCWDFGSGPICSSTIITGPDPDPTVSGSDASPWNNGTGGGLQHAPLEDGGSDRGGPGLGRILRQIGNFIPVLCGGGVFNYGGLRVSGGAASVSINQIRIADTRTGYSEAPFADISFGEVLMGGYGQALFSSGENEHFLFGGVGGDVGITKASASVFASHVSGDSIFHNSFGLNGDAGFLVFGGGVGVYVNTDSLTSCIDHGGH